MKKHIATFTATIAGTLFLAGLANAAINNATAYECSTGVVTAHPGDTLWSIASRYCTGHTGSAVSDMVAIHGTASLQVGDTVVLP